MPKLWEAVGTLMLICDPSVLSVKGQKVLHIDRNDHYGGYVSSLSRLRARLTKNSEAASVNIEAVS